MEATMGRLTKHTDLLAAGAVVLVVLMMIIPLPPALVDLCISLNISAALAIVVTTLYLPSALDFSSFPSLLLLTTLFRLAINVSVTRLVLLHGDAGGVVRSFGQFAHGDLLAETASEDEGLFGPHLLGRPQDQPPAFLLVSAGDRAYREPAVRGCLAEGGNEGRLPRGRGGRALHPGRHAGQADGDRRGPQRRPDHR